MTNPETRLAEFSKPLARGPMMPNPIFIAMPILLGLVAAAQDAALGPNKTQLDRLRSAGCTVAIGLVALLLLFPDLSIFRGSLAAVGLRHGSWLAAFTTLVCAGIVLLCIAGKNWWQIDRRWISLPGIGAFFLAGAVTSFRLAHVAT